MDSQDQQAQDILTKILEVDKKFRRARRQIIVLHNRLTDLVARYARPERKSFQYSICLQVTTGVKEMFMEYAQNPCQEINEL